MQWGSNCKSIRGKTIHDFTFSNKKVLKTKNQGQFIIAVLKVLEVKVVLVLRYLHYLHQKTPKQISDKIQQISDIFQQNISDIFQQTDISMIKSGNRHFGHIQAYFFGLIQHARF